MDPLETMLLPLEEMLADQGEQFQVGKEGLQALIDLQGFESKDVKVKLDKESNVVRIVAEREEERDGVKSFRTVQRNFALPKGMKNELLKTEMTPEGMLKITCPRDEALEEESKPLAVEEQKQEESKESKENQEQEIEVQVHAPQTQNPEPEVEITKEQPFEFSVNVSGFKPDNLSVDLNMDDKYVVVKASEEETQEDGSVVTRQMTKKMTIDPDLFDVEQMKSELHGNGNLKISAPRRQKGLEQKSKNIPIMQRD